MGLLPTMMSIFRKRQKFRRIVMTTIFHQKYEEVTYQIDVCCDKGAMVLTSTLTGRWNETQTIVLRDEHVQAIDHMWATLETSGKAKTYSIADSLDQDQPSF